MIVTALLVRGYEKSSFTGTARLPMRKEMSCLRLIIIVDSPSIFSNNDITEEVKSTALRALNLKYSANKIKWCTRNMISLRLVQKGWYTCFYENLQFSWATNGYSILAEKEVDTSTGRVISSKNPDRLTDASLEKQNTREIISTILIWIIAAIVIMAGFIFSNGTTTVTTTPNSDYYTPYRSKK